MDAANEGNRLRFSLSQLRGTRMTSWLGREVDCLLVDLVVVTKCAETAVRMLGPIMAATQSRQTGNLWCPKGSHLEQMEQMEIKPKRSPHYTVVVPVLNGGAKLHEVLRGLSKQTLPPDRVVLIDSGSTDSSLDVRFPSTVEIHALDGTFNHGSVRNQGAHLTESPYIVFMTQDAVPRPGAMAHLLFPLASGQAEASYARQVARDSASPLEHFARRYNYPAPQSPQNRESAVRRIYFSNACSAVSRRTFIEMGGFPTHTIMNEDMLFAHRLINAGYRVAYVPLAEVEHSHNYTPWQTLERYFDIGVFFSQASMELGDIRLSGEGLRYTAKLFTSLLSEGHYTWIPAAVAETLAKAVGIFLGKRHNLLPLRIKRRLSMHKAFWR